MFKIENFKVSFIENDKELAYVTYPLINENTVDINHTVVDESLRGRGIASGLLQEAYKDIKSKGLKAKATCSYAKKWFEKNKEYCDILDRKMERITSFTVNHLTLLPGLYVSREDTMDNFTFTTYDLRFTRPNFEPVLNTAPLHTIEHLGATFFRNKYKDITMYFGPMGCRTGFYLILKGKADLENTRKYLIECMNFIISFEGKVPGASPIECGNYLDLNLDMAKYHAKKYLEVLENANTI